jgi:hypothetical protein
MSQLSRSDQANDRKGKKNRPNPRNRRAKKEAAAVQAESVEEKCCDLLRGPLCEKCKVVQELEMAKANLAQAKMDYEIEKLRQEAAEVRKEAKVLSGEFVEEELPIPCVLDQHDSLGFFARINKVNCFFCLALVLASCLTASIYWLFGVLAGVAGLWYFGMAKPKKVGLVRASDRIVEVSRETGIDQDLLSYMAFAFAFTDGSVKNCLNAKHQARQWIRDHRSHWPEHVVLDQVAGVVALVNREMFLETTCFEAWEQELDGFKSMHDRARWRREGVSPSGGAAPRA